jgi:hypothetical protein
LEENFVIVFRGASTLTGGLGCHIQGSQSLPVLCACSYTCGCRLRFDIIVIIVSITTNIIMYKDVHASPVSPGNAQQIMSTVYTYGSLDT